MACLRSVAVDVAPLGRASLVTPPDSGDLRQRAWQWFLRPVFAVVE